jgi:hypothetical protein
MAHADAKFPKRRADGSFCVEVVVSVNTIDEKALSQRVQDWCTNIWAPEHKTWEFFGTSLYQDEFSCLPGEGRAHEEVCSWPSGLT